MKLMLAVLLLACAGVACAQASPGPLDVNALNALKVVEGAAVIVIPGKFEPSGNEQYLAAVCAEGESGIAESFILSFQNGIYQKRWQLPNGAGGLPLSPKSLAQFDNRYVDLGERHQLFYVCDFVRNGLDQVFMFHESGLGSIFSVYGSGGDAPISLLSIPIDTTYAYPIQTVMPGVLKIFPKDDTVEEISQTRYRLRFLIYTWDPSSWSYRQTGEGTQLAVWDQKTRLVYPIDEE